ACGRADGRGGRAAGAALARGLAAAQGTSPLASAPVVDALLRDLGGTGDVALAAADALDGAKLSSAQESVLETLAARAEGAVRARLFPALVRGAGVSQVVATLGDPDGGPVSLAAAASA